MSSERLPGARPRPAAELCEALGFEPKDLALYEQALVHRSLLNESGRSLGSNERMEFLGDSVLGLVVARFLYESLPDLSEGQLARRKSQLVSTPTLAEWARGMELGSYLRLGRGETLSGGSDKDSLLADGFEAWLGALYLDRGYRAAEALVLDQLKDQAAAGPGGRQADAKSRLQELSQKLYKRPPLYRVVSASGPDHEKTFEVEVVVEGKVLARGNGKNKKEAEQKGAEEALNRMATKHP
ncbi:MAG: ribonuclease III [bacterium]